MALVSLASPKVGRVRDHFFASVSFPLGVFVCVFFWAVHLYDQVWPLTVIFFWFLFVENHRFVWRATL